MVTIGAEHFLGTIRPGVLVPPRSDHGFGSWLRLLPLPSCTGWRALRERHLRRRILLRPSQHAAVTEAPGAECIMLAGVIFFRSEGALAEEFIFAIVTLNTREQRVINTRNNCLT